MKKNALVVAIVTLSISFGMPLQKASSSAGAEQMSMKSLAEQARTADDRGPVPERRDPVETVHRRLSMREFLLRVEDLTVERERREFRAKREDFVRRRHVRRRVSLCRVHRLVS